MKIKKETIFKILPYFIGAILGAVLNSQWGIINEIGQLLLWKCRIIDVLTWEFLLMCVGLLYMLICC